jgi:hypothetical protein
VGKYQFGLDVSQAKAQAFRGVCPFAIVLHRIRHGSDAREGAMLINGGF